MILLHQSYSVGIIARCGSKQHGFYLVSHIQLEGIKFCFWKRFVTKWLPDITGTRKRHGTARNLRNEKVISSIRPLPQSKTYIRSRPLGFGTALCLIVYFRKILYFVHHFGRPPTWIDQFWGRACNKKPSSPVLEMSVGRVMHTLEQRMALMASFRALLFL